MPEIRLIINGEATSVLVAANDTLIDILRDNLGLSGTKEGCGTGDCGACTILLNGNPVNACLVLAPEADDAEITTIEGIDHPVLEDFARMGAVQCGFCAPGAVVSTSALLEHSPDPTPAEIETALSGNLCRCTGYVRLLRTLSGESDSFDGDGTHRVVGKPVVRKDIRDKLKGKARFTADHSFPGMVHGVLVGATIPHGRIVSINTDQAKASEGVLLVITPEDVPDTKYGVSPARYDETILPKDTVRHLGEPVAAVIATSRRAAEMAAELIKVEYTPLEAVFSPGEALQKNAPLIHEQYAGNINTDISQNFADVNEAFTQADLIREDTYLGHRTYAAFLEPQASLAMEEDGIINLWTANQTPHHVQYNVSRVLDIPMNKLRVIKPAMGGGFGAKAEATKLDFLSIIAATKLKRPVLMVMDRKQSFYQGRSRHQQEISLKTAFSNEGDLLGCHEQVVLDGGAYTGYGIITAYYSGSLLTTPYKLPNFKFEAKRAVTNLPPCGAQRGNGTPYPRFAFESQLDQAAIDLGLDPITIRRRNLIDPGHVTANGLQITSCGIRECLDKIDEMADFSKKWSRLPYGHGIGLGLGCFISGAGGSIIRGDNPHSAVTVRVAEDGRGVYVYTGAPEIGQGSDTILCQIVAEELGIDYEDVSIFSSDSAIAPKDLGAYASRVTFMAGNAAVDAAKKLKAHLEDFWREEINDAAEGLTISDSIASAGGESREFSELAVQCCRKHGPVVATGSYDPPTAGGRHKGASVGTSPAYSFCAVAAEIVVDPETGFVRVTDMYAAHDSGTVINPVTFHGQVEGALVMGLGETLMEKVEHRDGRLLNPNLHDYLIPTIADAPRIHCATVPVSDPDGPFGAKEVGEGTILPVFGSLANAVADAVGVRITELPLTAEKVLWGINNQDN